MIITIVTVKIQADSEDAAMAALDRVQEALTLIKMDEASIEIKSVEDQ